MGSNLVAPSSYLWSGSPTVKNTAVKLVLGYIALMLFTLGIPALFMIATVVYWLAGSLYMYWKKSFRYYVTESRIIIMRSWIFGSKSRDITLDKIIDVRVKQGMLAKAVNCGTLTFVTVAGTEVEYVGVVTGAVVPRVLKGAWNTLMDISSPYEVKELIMKRVVAWREAFQQQRIAASLEQIAREGIQLRGLTLQQQASLADELTKLKNLLDSGAITQQEYEEIKKRIIEKYLKEQSGT